MRSQENPLFDKLHRVIGALKATLVYIKCKILSLCQPPIENFSLTPRQQPAKKPNTKLVLAETTDMNNKNKQLVLVEVEHFNDNEHFGSTLETSFPYPVHSYTIEGEDPNLRITHYPSNRLH